MCGQNRLGTFELDRRRLPSPFRAKRLFCLTQGKPWAKFSCPFGAGRVDPQKRWESENASALVVPMYIESFSPSRFLSGSIARKSFERCRSSDFRA
jgi:hypothetical protein